MVLKIAKFIIRSIEYDTIKVQFFVYIIYKEILNRLIIYVKTIFYHLFLKKCKKIQINLNV